MKQFFADFKKFAMRGNVVDLAVGVIIGAAFGSVTKSMVEDVMMPPLGLVIGRVDFKEMYAPLDLDSYDKLKDKLLDQEKAAVKKQNEERAAHQPPQPPLEIPTEKKKPSLQQAIDGGVPTLRFGIFINNCINFFFVALAVFLLVKIVTRLQKQEPPPTKAELSTSEKLLSEIRDELKKGHAKTG
jgi:large conductance mechanosensitive channel